MESRWPALLTAAGCSQQSRRGNFSFAVIHHRAGRKKRRREEGRKDRATPDSRRLASFKRLHMAHSWLALVRTCGNTHTHTRSSQSRENILAHVPVFFAPPLVALFLSAAGERSFLLQRITVPFSLFIFDPAQCRPLAGSQRPVQVRIKKEKKEEEEERS